MSVRLLVKVRSQCRKVAILKVFNITSLIIPILVNVQVSSARGRHERSVFCFPWKVPLFRVLNHTVWSWSWWLSDWSHCHFNSRYNHVINCSQNCVMELIFNDCNGIVNFVSDFVGNSSLYDLIMTGTVFTECEFLKVINKTTALRFPGFFYNCICVGIVANNDIT